MNHLSLFKGSGLTGDSESRLKEVMAPFSALVRASLDLELSDKLVLDKNPRFRFGSGEPKGKRQIAHRGSG